MAVFAFTNAKVTVNSVDLSDHVKSVSINYSAEELDDTAMGDTSKSRIAGLKDWSVEVTWNQDYATGKVDATCWPLVGAAAFPIAVVPVNAAVSATNPNYNGSCVLTSYATGNGVGELASGTTTFAGDGTLTRSVA